MRVCQGCRGMLKHSDGSVPASPFDLCAARAERCSFWDTNGISITPRKEQPMVWTPHIAKTLPTNNSSVIEIARLW